jgi:hypothetical protein
MIDEEYMTGLNNIRRNASFASSIQIFRELMEEASPRGITSSAGVFLKSGSGERLGCSFHHRLWVGCLLVNDLMWAAVG